jgi:hypothetical protein
MNKRILILFLAAVFFLPGYLTGRGYEKCQDEQESYDVDPLISGVSLVKSLSYNRDVPPMRIILGIDLRKEAHYKLLDEEGVLRGGLFMKGFNVLHIDSPGYFEKSGLHTFTLDVISGNVHQTRTISLEIKVDAPKLPEKKSAPPKEIKYNLSMYVGDRLIISSKKLPGQVLGFKFDLPKIDAPDPFKPPDKGDPMLNSVSIIDVALIAAKMLTGLVLKKDEEKKEYIVQKYQQVTLTFMKKDPLGIPRKVTAVMTLRPTDKTE